MDSILDSTKKALGIEITNTDFDVELIIFINSVLSTLNQLGAGPDPGFSIEDSSDKWSDLLGVDPRRNDIKQYVYLRTRLVFDPPTTAHLLNSVKELVQEAEWRINVRREGEEWVPPPTPLPLMEPQVIVVSMQQEWA